MSNTQLSSNPNVFSVQEKLLHLQAALLAATPDMPTLLRDIHTQLKKDPEVVTILTEDQCAVIVQGLVKVTNSTIAAAAISKAPKKALSKITVSDL